MYSQVRYTDTGIVLMYKRMQKNIFCGSYINLHFFKYMYVVFDLLPVKLFLAGMFLLFFDKFWSLAYLLV